MRYTQTTLKKLEELFHELDYSVRYEKGNFQSGYCIVEHRKIAILNKFFDTEARINCLLDILSKLEFEPGQLSEPSRALIGKWRESSGSGSSSGSSSGSGSGSGSGSLGEPPEA